MALCPLQKGFCPFFRCFASRAFLRLILADINERLLWQLI